jgi:hypothetical protein
MTVGHTPIGAVIQPHGPRRKIKARKLLQILQQIDDASGKALIAYCIGVARFVATLTEDEREALAAGTVTIGELQLQRSIANGHSDLLLRQFNDRQLFDHLDKRTAPTTPRG